MIRERIEALRKAMKQANVAAYVIPSSDAHLSEYPPLRWTSREWISGFTGSAGTVVVFADEAILWTDSRYFLQAEEELKGSGIVLFKEGEPSVPSISEYIAGKLKQGESVGLDGATFSINQVEAFQTYWSSKGISVNSSLDLIDTIWNDRPSIPKDAPFILDIAFAGKKASEKIGEVRDAMQAKGATHIIAAALDEVAWLFNIRGTDVPYNPVTVAYGLVTLDSAWLFIEPDKIHKEFAEELHKEGIQIGDYKKFADFLGKQPAQSVFWTDANRTNYTLAQSLPQGAKTIRDLSPITMLKAIRNEVELQGVKEAMRRDGATLIRFMKWLEETVQTTAITEHEIAVRLKEFRAEGDLFVGESFGSIVGYNANGAIVHYHPSETTSAVVKPEGMLLIDSGGQYFDGTTDITRTFHLSTPTQQQRRDYTLVLKGHIAIATAKFPEGTRGAQLDALARINLWKAGANYGHGTGHGIGHFLNVHEGPQNIRKEENPVTLRSGMMVSNEPGLYRAGAYGIRIENIVAVAPREQTEFGQFYGFDTLTIYPYCNKLIDRSMLSAEETDYIEQYHKRVVEELTPLLSEEEQSYLLSLVAL